MPAARRDWLLPGVGLFAVVFGAVTIRAGGSVLFGSDEARRAAGAYVEFVVWFNFLAGFAYVLAGAGLLARRRWAVGLAAGIVAATLVVFLAFGLHIAAGGAWEARTMAAMTLRTLVWAAIATLAWRRIGRLA